MSNERNSRLAGTHVKGLRTAYASKGFSEAAAIQKIESRKPEKRAWIYSTTSVTALERNEILHENSAENGMRSNLDPNVHAETLYSSFIKRR